MDHLIAEIHSAPKAETGELFAPGEIEFRRREKALKQGIDLPEDVVASLRGLAEDLGMPLPEELRK
jgi:LDH2 family malate/lactate/ureidoglycolate dehydrogenase